MNYQRLYETTARKFSRIILKYLNGDICSIVLYGSVARKRSSRDSDIDILIIGRNKNKTEKMIFDVSHDVDYYNDFKTFLAPVFLTAGEIKRDVAVGSYFIIDILTQGVILYDDGTIRRIRKKTLGSGG